MMGSDPNTLCDCYLHEFIRPDYVISTTNSWYWMRPGTFTFSLHQSTSALDQFEARDEVVGQTDLTGRERAEAPRN